MPATSLADVSMRLATIGRFQVSLNRSGDLLDVAPAGGLDLKVVQIAL
jgi:hypothetical protein